MKAIRTRFTGPTTRYPEGRLIASDEDGNRVAIAFNQCAGSRQAAHFEAARALADRMQWHGQLAGGALRGGYVWVWVEQWTTYTIGYIEQSNRRAAESAARIAQRLVARERARRKAIKP